RESVVERLARFGAAYVQLRAPFLEAHGAQLQRAPSVGAWLGPGDLRARGIRGLGGGPWAVSLFGGLRPEDLDAAAAAKVAGLGDLRVPLSTRYLRACSRARTRKRWFSGTPWKRCSSGR